MLGDLWTELWTERKSGGTNTQQGEEFPREPPRQRLTALASVLVQSDRKIRLAGSQVRCMVNVW